MKTLTQLFAAGALVAVAACQDGPTAPGDDDVSGARSTTKTSTDVRITAVHFGTDGTVTYSVRVRSNRMLSSFQGILWFAPGNFELRSQTPAPVPAGIAMVNSTDVASGRIRFSAYTQTAFQSSPEGTEVFRIVVRPLQGGDPGFTGMLDVIGTATTTTSPAGAGTIAAGIAADEGCSGTTLWGDGNADGNVNITDAQQLARYSTGLQVGNWSAVTTRGDVTADGSVNIVDAQQVARYSVGLTAAPRTNTWIC